MTANLTEMERQFLLNLARTTITNAIKKLPLITPAPGETSPALEDNGACFVTLTIDGQLRGCIGSLEAHQSLVEDVRERAFQAAFDDYRFPPLTEAELETVKIEISRLTPPVDLQYSKPEELLTLLRPGIDGVILQSGFKRATFLPQVWGQLPRHEDFLDHLCAKMGAARDLWRREKLDVKVYQVEEFHE